VLAERSICPLEVLMNTSPAVEEKVPAVPAVKEGEGFAASLQYGEPV